VDRLPGVVSIFNVASVSYRKARAAQKSRIAWRSGPRNLSQSGQLLKCGRELVLCFSGGRLGDFESIRVRRESGFSLKDLARNSRLASCPVRSRASALASRTSNTPISPIPVPRPPRWTERSHIRYLGKRCRGVGRNRRHELSLLKTWTARMEARPCSDPYQGTKFPVTKLGFPVPNCREFSQKAQ
jgi:hypothetical protein